MHVEGASMERENLFAKQAVGLCRGAHAEIQAPSHVTAGVV